MRDPDYYYANEERTTYQEDEGQILMLHLHAAWRYGRAAALQTTAG